MTKKHFRMLAKEFHDMKPIPVLNDDYANKPYEMWSGMVAKAADVCAQVNPNFDRETFLTACREGL